MMERRTDLAIETRESFPGDGGEIEGVSLNKEKVSIDEDDKVWLEISTVKILDEQGAQSMNKPVGSYITIETGNPAQLDDNDRESIATEIGKRLELLSGKLKSQKVLVAGLGNREVTADSLGPIAVNNLEITRHFAKEFGYSFLEKCNLGELCAISPGVMAQTGMEAEEVLHAISDTIKPDVVLVIDALAARSVSRVASTIQITDTGINPGSGVGNHRLALNHDSLGVKVIAIGVPTVVEAEVIVEDRIENFMVNQGFSDEDVRKFIQNMGEPAIKGMYVTPKNIDETVRLMGEMLADSINLLIS